MRYSQFAFFIVLVVILLPVTVFAAPCQTGDPFPYTSPYEDRGDCPADIQAWLDRANGCGHYMNEEKYGYDRNAFLDEQMTIQGCRILGCDFNALFSQYEGDLAYTVILTGYAEQVFGNIDNMPACPEDDGRAPVRTQQ